MGKKKNKDPGGNRQAHPQQSFQQMVADATLTKFKGYIDANVQQLAQALVQRQAQMQQDVLTRIVAIEEILMENFEGLTKNALAEKVAVIQDRSEGLESVEGKLEVGDRVRVEVKVKTAEQEEFQNPSRFMIDNTGSGSTLGKELEEAMVGMSAGETKEVKFGKDKTLTALIEINKISRRPKPVEVKEETKGEEAASANPNAG